MADITKSTTVDQITAQHDGTLMVRMGLGLWEDGTALHTAYHRWVLAPHENVVSRLTEVETALAALGWPPVPPTGRAWLIRVAAAARLT